MVQYVIKESEEHVIMEAGKLHLETCLKDLEENHTCIPIKKSDLIISYCETISKESNMLCLSKSPKKNKHLLAQTFPNGMAKNIDKGKELSRELATWLRSMNGMWQRPTRFDQVRHGGWLPVATKEGALCEENMQNVCFNVYDVTLHMDIIHSGDNQIILMA
ncbi:hypothetical protein HPG69_000348 [Diceros bicornis minor]|uniref:Elongation factor 2 n=1 Tax=Diceros bicornis minor TaxID=77932 RepID=A0A7J7EVP9_DICBM|nr:hypothetical protein HPG69_000348 [Diceros bicornis minor]